MSNNQVSFKSDNISQYHNYKGYLYDPEHPGLALLCNGKGSYTYYLAKKVPGTNQLVRRKIARVGELSFESVLSRFYASVTRLLDGDIPETSLEKKFSSETIQGLYERYVSEHSGLRDSTRATYDCMFDQHFGAVKDKSVRAITSEDVRRVYKKALDPEGKNRHASAEKTLMLFTAILNFAVSREIIELNPATAVRKGLTIQRNAKDRYLSRAELKRFVIACEEELSMYDDHASRYAVGPHMFLMALYTGARRANIREMEWSEIDHDTKVWTIPARKYKGKRKHKVYLSTQAYELLCKMQHRDGYVYSDGKGGYVQDVRKRLDSLCKLARLKTRFTFHDFRHTFASYAIQAGVEFQMVQAMLGHKLPGVTARYIHLADHQMATQFQILADYYDEVLSLEG